MMQGFRDVFEVAKAKVVMGNSVRILDWLTAAVTMIGKPVYESYEAIKYDTRKGKPIKFDWVADEKSIDEIQVFNHSSFISRYLIPTQIKNDIKKIQDSDDTYYFAIAGQLYSIQSMKRLDQDDRTVRAGVIIKKTSIKFLDI